MTSQYIKFHAREVLELLSSICTVQVILITWPYAAPVKTAKQVPTKLIYFKAILHSENKLI
jgi:hypothetical protein